MQSPIRDEGADVVIVGAGQAGLSLGYYLTRQGVDVLLLEQASAIGTSWARRWDSLRLFTPARYNALPGSDFPASAWSYPVKDDVATYLSQYAARFALPVRTSAEVVSLEGVEGSFRLTLATGESISAARVVVATGAFGTPWVPSFTRALDARITQVHTDDYRNPTELPPGNVLVVGGGNSGVQIALELAEAGRVAHLSDSARARSVPQRIIGRDLFWWLTTTGVIHARTDSRIGRRLRANDPVIGTSRRALRRAGVIFHPRTAAGASGTVTFADGATMEPDVVVWATGYRHDDRWITAPGALDPTGALIVEADHTSVPGLYALGRPWQRDRGSALLGYVQYDANRLAARLSQSTATA